MTSATRTIQPAPSSGRSMMCIALLSLRAGRLRRWRAWAQRLRSRFAGIIARRSAVNMVFLHPMIVAGRWDRSPSGAGATVNLRLAFQPILKTCRHVHSLPRDRAAGCRSITVRSGDAGTIRRASTPGSAPMAVSARPARWASGPGEHRDDPNTSRSVVGDRGARSESGSDDRAGTVQRRHRTARRPTALIIAADQSMRTVRLGRRATPMVDGRAGGSAPRALRDRRRVETTSGVRVGRTFRQSGAEGASSGQASVPRSPRAEVRDRSRPAAPAPAIDVQALTDRVVRQIDQRFSAWRERTGRA